MGYHDKLFLKSGARSALRSIRARRRQTVPLHVPPSAVVDQQRRDRARATSTRDRPEPDNEDQLQGNAQSIPTKAPPSRPQPDIEPGCEQDEEPTVAARASSDGLLPLRGTPEEVTADFHLETAIQRSSEEVRHGARNDEEEQRFIELAFTASKVTASQPRHSSHTPTSSFQQQHLLATTLDHRFQERGLPTATDKLMPTTPRIQRERSKERCRSLSGRWSRPNSQWFQSAPLASDRSRLHRTYVKAVVPVPPATRQRLRLLHRRWHTHRANQRKLRHDLVLQFLLSRSQGGPLNRQEYLTYDLHLRFPRTSGRSSRRRLSS